MIKHVTKTTKLLFDTVMHIIEAGDGGVVGACARGPYRVCVWLSLFRQHPGRLCVRQRPHRMQTHISSLASGAQVCEIRLLSAPRLAGTQYEVPHNTRVRGTGVKLPTYGVPMLKDDNHVQTEKQTPFILQTYRGITCK